jgi:uncharacterized protein YgbK (DUF1537 family)
MMSILLGCIADDFTGGTDIALTLVRGGMRTIQLLGVPSAGTDIPAADAIVVSLKSRTNPADEAIQQSRAAADFLRAAGARRLFFKYCSTFDSTDDGNIGPVAEALLDRVDGDLTIACPTFPANGRTVYQGHLFVGSALLSESPLKDHPLTPMRDPNLVRVLQRQTNLKVGLVPMEVVDKGAKAITEAFAAAREVGDKILIIDAITDRNLMDIGSAAFELSLVTGGSGVALGLPEAFRRSGLLETADMAAELTAPPGNDLILAGSCSAATRNQVQVAENVGLPSLAIDPLALHTGAISVTSIIDWASANGGDRPVLIYSSAEPNAVARAQDTLGRDAAGALIEDTLARVAVRLVDSGVRRLIVAGGETSGAVVAALGVSALRIGPEIDPGVPWTLSLSDPQLALALKSGNFGAPDFFLKAWDMV